MNGWMGKILKVDLTTSEIRQIETEPYAQKYLGGRGIGAAPVLGKCKARNLGFRPK